MVLALDERDYLIAGVLGSVSFVLFVLIIILFAMHSSLKRKVKKLMTPAAAGQPQFHPPQQDDLARRGYQEYQGQGSVYSGQPSYQQGQAYPQQRRENNDQMINAAKFGAKAGVGAAKWAAKNPDTVQGAFDRF